MDIPTTTQLKELSQRHDPTNLTLMLPTHRMARETSQDPIRLKNLLRDAEERLKNRGVKAAEIQRRLAPTKELLDDELFWQHQSDGLALLIGPEETKRFRLPVHLPERVAIDVRFHLAPLLSAVTDNEAFFLLALSPNRVQLFRGDRDSFQAVEVPDLPADFEEYGRVIDDDRGLSFHTEAPPHGPAGNRDVQVHGHPSGGDAEEEKQRMLEFCRMVAARLHPVLNQQTMPLILACDKRVVPMYRQVNEYARLQNEAIAGNPDDATDAKLHSRAWELIRQQLPKTEQQDRSRLEAALAGQLGSDKLSELVPAAIDGRIETLWVAADRQQWGRFNPENREVTLSDTPHNDDQELINAVALDTFSQGGRVYVRLQEALPTQSVAAAIMRY